MIAEATYDKIYEGNFSFQWRFGDATYFAIDHFLDGLTQKRCNVIIMLDDIVISEPPNYYDKTRYDNEDKCHDYLDICIIRHEHTINSHVERHEIVVTRGQLGSITAQLGATDMSKGNLETLVNFSEEDCDYYYYHFHDIPKLINRWFLNVKPNPDNLFRYSLKHNINTIFTINDIEETTIATYIEDDEKWYDGYYPPRYVENWENRTIHICRIKNSYLPEDIYYTTWKNNNVHNYLTPYSNDGDGNVYKGTIASRCIPIKMQHFVIKTSES